MEIELTIADQIPIKTGKDVYPIIQKILKRETKFNENEKTSFWVAGIDENGVLSLIDLMDRVLDVSPMNVFRMALIKNAPIIVLVHKLHNLNTELPHDLADLTDRLIQVGRIINVHVLDHLIITPSGYYSFEEKGLMTDLILNSRWVPTYKVVQQIKNEHEQILAMQDQLYNELKEQIEESLLESILFFRERGLSDKEIMQGLNLKNWQMTHLIKSSKKIKP